MKRRLFKLLFLVSFVLGVLLFVICAISFFVIASGYRNGSQSAFTAFVGEGCVSIIYQRGPGMAADWQAGEPPNTWNVGISLVDPRQAQLKRLLIPEHMDFTGLPASIQENGMYIPLWMLTFV